MAHLTGGRKEHVAWISISLDALKHTFGTVVEHGRTLTDLRHGPTCQCKSSGPPTYRTTFSWGKSTQTI